MSREQRRHLRLPLASTVFIELLAAGPGDNESCQLLFCETGNISHDGLCVFLDQPLIQDSILQIGVELPSIGATLYLVGEVKWCRQQPSNPKRWSAGFQLINTAGSDIDRWYLLTSQLAAERNFSPNTAED